MPVVVLLTDFGVSDYYVGVMKGVIAAINPLARVVDLTHLVEPQNVREASFILWASYSFFPDDSIFVSVIDPGVGSDRKIICGRLDGRLFIAPDNALLDYVVAEAREVEFHEVSNRKFFARGVSNTFHGRDIFAPVAAHLSRGAAIHELGERFRYPRVEKFYSGISKGMNFGRVVYIDHFGNILTSFLWNDELLNGRSTLSAGKRRISKYYCSYSAAPGKGLIGVNGSSGLLEISVNRGSAARILRSKVGNKLTLRHP